MLIQTPQAVDITQREFAEAIGAPNQRVEIVIDRPGITQSTALMLSRYLGTQRALDEPPPDTVGPLPHPQTRRSTKSGRSAVIPVPHQGEKPLPRSFALKNCQKVDLAYLMQMPWARPSHAPRHHDSDGESLPRIAPMPEAVAEARKPHTGHTASTRDFASAPGATRTPNLLIRSQTEACMLRIVQCRQMSSSWGFGRIPGAADTT